MTDTPRREALRLFSLGVIVGGAALASASQAADRPPTLVPRGAGRLHDLVADLARTRRHRDFKTVPMILTSPDQWDSEALARVISYQGGPKQVWDNTDLASPWLNLMRNSLNTQIWSFKNPDFLVVSATHGSAHLALFDDTIWQKYEIPRLMSEKMSPALAARFKINTLMKASPAAEADSQAFENPAGAFSPADNSIPSLMRRGAVFLACHNAIWEITAAMLSLNINPDHLSHEAMAADLTNHLVDGVVLTPGVVGTLPQLQQAGFFYAA